MGKSKSNSDVALNINSVLAINGDNIKQRKYILQLIFWSALTASLIFIPPTLINHGIFTLIADFNEQQTGFNILANHAIKNGDIFWNWQVDLGGNFIGMFSFYNLGSPFFWLTLPLPDEIFPFLMPYILILKYIVAALTAFLYLRRFVNKPHYCQLGAMLYAFSGFQVINLMFNHFHDVVAFFPLLLLSMEYLAEHKKHGFFLLMVAFSACLNYFFFVGEFIFILIYFIIRFLLPNWRSGLKLIPKFLAEGLLGGMISATILLPSIFWTLTNPRLNSNFSWRSALIYNKDVYINLLKSFLLPTDMMAAEITTFYSGYTSMSCWLPLFGFLPIILFLRTKNRQFTWLKRIIITLLIIASVPILNSSFYAFNTAYYARWFYMLSLMLSLATVIVMSKLDEIDFKLRRNTSISYLLIILALFTYYALGQNLYTEFGLVYRAEPFLIWFIITLITVILGSYYILRKLNSQRFISLVLTLTIVIIVTHAWHIQMNQNLSLRTDSVEANYSTVQTGLNIRKFCQENNINSESFPYRFRTYDDRCNASLVAAVPSINSFISTVSGSIPRFYNFVNSSRFVISRNENPWLQRFLGAKFLVSNTRLSQTEFWQKNDRFNSTYIYTDDLALPLAVMHTKYIGPENFYILDHEERCKILLRAVVSPRSKIDFIRSQQISESAPNETADKASLGVYPDYITGRLEHLSVKDIYDFSEQKSIEDCRQRQSQAGFNFQFTSRGVSFDINGKNNSICLLTIPWDKDWLCKVNGEIFPAQNMGGLVVLPLQNNLNHIELVYRNSSLKKGLELTAAGFLLTIIYLLLISQKLGKYFMRENP